MGLRGALITPVGNDALLPCCVKYKRLKREWLMRRLTAYYVAASYGFARRHQSASLSTDHGVGAAGLSGYGACDRVGLHVYQCFSRHFLGDFSPPVSSFSPKDWPGSRNEPFLRTRLNTMQYTPNLCLTMIGSKMPIYHFTANHS